MKFNKEIDLLKKNQIEMLLEMKNPQSQIKNSLESLTSRVTHREEAIRDRIQGRWIKIVKDKDKLI